jgi:hypothetical protein
MACLQNMRELYRLVLVDTPLAPYFSENLSHEDLDEMNIEVNSLRSLRLWNRQLQRLNCAQLCSLDWLCWQSSCRSLYCL